MEKKAELFELTFKTFAEIERLRDVLKESKNECPFLFRMLEYKLKERKDKSVVINKTEQSWLKENWDLIEKKMEGNQHMFGNQS